VASGAHAHIGKHRDAGAPRLGFGPKSMTAKDAVALASAGVFTAEGDC